MFIVVPPFLSYDGGIVTGGPWGTLAQADTPRALAARSTEFLVATRAMTLVDNMIDDVYMVMEQTEVTRMMWVSCKHRVEIFESVRPWL